MIRPIIKFLFLIPLFAFHLFSQNISSINISGISEFSRQDYLNWSGISSGMKIFPGITDSVENRITTELTRNGYLNSKVSAETVIEDSVKTIVNISISEGEATTIGNIEITGKDSAVVASISSLFSELEGLTFSTALIELTISSALDYCEENGYPFASIKISSINILNDSAGNSTAGILLVVSEGELCRINKIETEGNEKTNPNVITRQIRLGKDDIYRQSVIDQIPQQLNKLTFFESVQPPQFYFNSKNEGILKITVVERSTNNFDGIIGYTPGDENEKGYLTGFVNISLRNLFGTGRAFAVKWEQLDRSSQNLELNYKEPWFLNLPLNLRFSLFQRKQDSTFVRRKISAEAEYLATENFSFSALFSTGETIPTELKDKRFTVYKSDNVETGFNLKYDVRDDIFSPRKGLFFNNTYLFSRKRITGPEEYIQNLTDKNINLQRIELDIHYYFQIFKNQVIAAKIQGRELSGNTTEISDLYLMGGTNSLRGYREDQFAGNRVIWENLEYRILLGGKSFTFLFADAGYYLRKSEPGSGIQKSESIKTGFGAGINVETGIGIISVSYALGEGDSFSNGKIHFGLVNEF